MRDFQVIFNRVTCSEPVHSLVPSDYSLFAKMVPKKVQNIEYRKKKCTIPDRKKFETRGKVLSSESQTCTATWRGAEEKAEAESEREAEALHWFTRHEHTSIDWQSRLK